MERLQQLFEKTFGSAPERIEPLPAHGSPRRYLRLRAGKHTAIGALNEDVAENRAFIHFSRHFRQQGLPVPEIYAVAEDEKAYLEEDLGDDTLFDLLQQERAGKQEVPARIAEYYAQAVRWLPRFQIQGAQGLDFSVCYPHQAFDRRSMLWDLNYFKYYFLKLAYIPFHEKRLEDDFQTFTDYLLQAPADYFLYRDFQSRNIMVKEGRVYFIDYQGGRKGALPYDLASLLFDSKADLPFPFRRQLLGIYLQELSRHMPVDQRSFMEFFHAFVLIRIMQAMGAYGYRGFYERKTHFLQSIPYAVRNLEHLIKHYEPPIALPELWEVFRQIIQSSKLRQYGQVQLPLTVRVISFSYRNGVPVDEKGHGGGFVFDCRYLPNPGRDVRFKNLTGKDAETVAYFRDKPEVDHFLNRVEDILDATVQSYLKQNFTDLMVCFGCTGGQHRSVYVAEQVAQHLQRHQRVKVQLIHRELAGGIPRH